MNATQLLRQLGMDHTTATDLAAADEIIAEILRGAADFIEAADLNPPGDGHRSPTYHNRRAAFLLRRMAPPSVRGVVRFTT